MVSGDVAAGVMLDLLEGTLWQRQLGSLSEELVSTMVAQVRVYAYGRGGETGRVV
jgi:hypothetical protein